MIWRINLADFSELPSKLGRLASEYQRWCHQHALFQWDLEMKVRSCCLFDKHFTC